MKLFKGLKSKSDVGEGAGVVQPGQKEAQGRSYHSLKLLSKAVVRLFFQIRNYRMT